MKEITVREFISLGYSSWFELHWTLAATEEQAEKRFSDLGLHDVFYKVQFGWWYPIK